VAAAVAACVLALPDPEPSLAPQVAANMHSTGLGNPIAAVLLGFRAMDTLLEAIVLIFALIGVWSLGPDRAWGGRPGNQYSVEPDGIVAFTARVLAPIGIMVGIYIFWVGADHPGGKFQGATILAAMWLLVARAGLSDAPPISGPCLRLALVAGPAVFIAIGFLGAASAGAFLAYPEGFAKPLILGIEWALLPSLVLTLFLLLAGPPQRLPAP
jgi:multisubunit Na+/H+ antiporter MnhB subunit